MSKKVQLYKKIIKHKQYIIPLVAVVIILAVVLGVNIYNHNNKLNLAEKDVRALMAVLA